MNNELSEAKFGAIYPTPTIIIASEGLQSKNIPEAMPPAPPLSSCTLLHDACIFIVQPDHLYLMATAL